MTRLLLHVNRKSPAWTEFEAHRVNELPVSLQDELKKLGFERRHAVHKDPEHIWVSMMHHSGHIAMVWSFVVQLVGLGYNFLDRHEREQCKEGETALMEMVVKEKK